MMTDNPKRAISRIVVFDDPLLNLMHPPPL
jgi:hypothetical protein